MVRDIVDILDHEQLEKVIVLTHGWYASVLVAPLRILQFLWLQGHVSGVGNANLAASSPETTGSSSRRPRRSAASCLRGWTDSPERFGRTGQARGLYCTWLACAGMQDTVMIAIADCAEDVMLRP